MRSHAGAELTGKQARRRIRVILGREGHRPRAAAPLVQRGVEAAVPVAMGRMKTIPRFSYTHQITRRVSHLVADYTD